jgi:nucleotidyltransferase substrate binding protein (TIGR01987 family)
MSVYQIELGFLNVEKALKSLEGIAFKEILEDRSTIDATIQRFEFTIELFWKLLKAILKEKGAESQYPKDVLKEAYLGHLIDHEDIWLSMLKDRNLTSHTYDEKLADEIYERIKKYIPIFRETLENLSKGKKNEF